MVHSTRQSHKRREPGTSRNIAARMGRWSAMHWKTATLGWLIFVIVAFALGGMVGTKTIDTNAPGPGESGRMDRILEAGFKQPAGESVLVQSASLRVNDAAFTAAVDDVVARVSKVGAVQGVRSPLAPGNSGQIAKNGHAALVEFQIRGDADKAAEKIGPVLDQVAAAQRAHPQLFIGEFGYASASDAGAKLFADDLSKAGLLSVPITLIILVLAFGALVAAGIPLLLALTAVFATFGIIALPSQLLPMRPEMPALVLLVGLAVGVDYSMFYLKRERQERAAGRSATGGARSRRRHLRPLGAHLGTHRDGGHGRHVPDGRRGLRLVRPGDDPGCRRRRSGVADRPARRALDGSATRSTGCASRSSAGAAAATAKAASGARSSTASCAGPSSRRSSPAACSSRSRLRRCSCTWPPSGRRRSRSPSTSSRPTIACRRRSPARLSRRTSWSRRRT